MRFPTPHSPRQQYISAAELRLQFRPPPSLRTIRSWTKARILPSIRIGGLVFYDEVALKAKIENQLTVRVRTQNKKGEG